MASETKFSTFLDSLKEKLHRSKNAYAILLLISSVFLYGLLHNGYWTPGNDSEVYLTAARNLVQGNGYSFNGLPLRHYPPGWPALLAAVMKISRAFWVLNLLAKLLLVVALLLFYFCLLRYTSPIVSFSIMLITATMWHWFRYGYVLYSESLFYFLFAASLLLAFRVREEKAGKLQISLLLTLCVLMPLVRWMGILTSGMVSLTTVSGQIRPQIKKKWLIFLSGCILGLASFWGTLHLVQNILPGTKPQIRETTNSYLLEHQEAKHFGETQLPVRQHLLSPDLRWWWRQTQQLGTWIVLLLWPIAQLGSIYDHLLVRIIVNVPGWFLTICVLCYMGKKIKTKDWLWLGILFYVGVLFLIHRLRGRYLAPFAPLLLYAIWNSTRGLATSMAEKIEGKSPLQKLRALPYLLLAIIAASNLFVYSVAVRVQRSSDFYATFRAGQYRTIVNAAHYISKQTPPETRIAVTCHAQNLKKHFQYLGPQGPAGSLALLTGRKVIAIQSMSGDKIEGTDQIRKWAEQTNSDYLLVRLPTSPWRLWHFRIPTIQKWLTGRKKIPENPYWLFYKIDKGQIRELTVPNVRNYPTHVPYAR